MHHCPHRLSRRALSAALVLSFLAALGACSSMQVHTDFDEGVDFTEYRTYRWDMKQTRNRKDINSLLDKRIRDAVDDELAAKGLERVEAGADLVVTYRAGVREKVDVTSTWYAWGYRRRGVRVDRYKQGSIVIDLIDPDMKQLVWRGAAVGVVDASDKSQEKVAEKVAKILAGYPPGTD